MNTTVKEIIDFSEKSLKNELDSGIHTGNRPRFPMFIMCNNSQHNNVYGNMERFLKRIWPQAVQDIFMFQYTCNSGNISFQDYRNNYMSIEDNLTCIIDKIQEKKDVFANLQKFRFYNIIDTSIISDINIFDKYYSNAIIEFEKLDINYEFMLIVLLDDSNEHRPVTNSIRKYLSEHRKYDSTIIISNRPRRNNIDRSNEWHRIASNVIILSNNDANADYDDENVKTRSLLLYNDHSTFTVSYKLFDKPVHEIVLQIVTTIFSKIKLCLNEKKVYDNNQWKSKLGFESGDNIISNEYFKDNSISFDTDYFDRLPMKNIPKGKNKSLVDCTYKDFCTFSYEEVFKYYAKEFVQREISNGTAINDCICKFHDFITERVSIDEIKLLYENTIKTLFMDSNITSPQNYLNIKEYFEKYIKTYVIKEIMYPKFIYEITKLKNNAEKIEKFIEKLNEELKSMISADNSSIGDIYQNSSKDYLQSVDGNNMMKEILNLDNTEDDIIQTIKKCFKNIIKHNEELFLLPFVEEYQRRLNKTGEHIYTQISKDLTCEIENNVRLHGSFKVDCRLKVYLFNLGNPEENKYSQVYEYLKRTFENDDTVQYFNTGYNDSIEGIVFVPCDGKDILM